MSSSRSGSVDLKRSWLNYFTGQGAGVGELDFPVARAPLPFHTGKIQWKGQANTVGTRVSAGVTGRFCDVNSGLNKSCFDVTIKNN